ncbi:MAG: phosphatidate cytidylyltransferase [Polyangiaceae bacterium]
MAAEDGGASPAVEDAAKQAKKPRSNLVQRLLTAAVAVPLLLLLAFPGAPWMWAAFIALATLVGALELYGMTHHGDRVAQVVLVAMTGGVFATLWFAGRDPKALVALLLLLPIASTLLALARLGEIPTAALRYAASTFGPIFLGGGMAALAMLKRDGKDDGPAFILFTLMLSWLSDTGAYFAGRFLGKRKLYPAVSPKKTIAGAIGGIAGSSVGAALATFVYLKSMPALHAFGFGVIGGALGQLGDLGESLLKRSVGVKDSGGIVPGHGGILDRVDALLVTSTLLWLYIVFVRG